MDFDCDSIKSLSKACSKNIDAMVSNVSNGIASKNAVPGTNIRMISIRRLVVATNNVNYQNVIRQTPDLENMHYVNVHVKFKTD